MRCPAANSCKPAMGKPCSKETFCISTNLPSMKILCSIVLSRESLLLELASEGGGGRKSKLGYTQSTSQSLKLFHAGSCKNKRCGKVLGSNRPKTPRNLLTLELFGPITVDSDRFRELQFGAFRTGLSRHCFLENSSPISFGNPSCVAQCSRRCSRFWGFQKVSRKLTIG